MIIHIIYITSLSLSLSASSGGIAFIRLGIFGCARWQVRQRASDLIFVPSTLYFCVREQEVQVEDPLLVSENQINL